MLPDCYYSEIKNPFCPRGQIIINILNLFIMDLNDKINNFADFKDNDNGAKVGIFVVFATAMIGFGKYVIDSIDKKSSCNKEGQI